MFIGLKVIRIIWQDHVILFLIFFCSLGKLSKL
jgi:hypothetical protein